MHAGVGRAAFARCLAAGNTRAWFVAVQRALSLLLHAGAILVAQDGGHVGKVVAGGGQ